MQSLERVSLVANLPIRMSHDAATESNGIDSKIAKHDRSKELLESWLNKVLKIEITDGRVLIGTFLCTDRDLNIILGSCLEYVNDDKGTTEEEPRSLGLVMVPGKHVVSINVDVQTNDV